MSTVDASTVFSNFVYRFSFGNSSLLLWLVSVTAFFERIRDSRYERRDSLSSLLAADPGTTFETSLSAQRAAAPKQLRAGVKLDTCAQLSEAGS